MDPSSILGWVLFGPGIVAILVAVLGRWPNVRETATLLGSSTIFAAVAGGLLPAVQSGERPSLDLGEILPGLRLAFEIEPLGMVFALVASGLWIVTSLYAVGYMRGHHEKKQTRFFICFALAIFGALGVAFAANMFTLFVFYEAITLSTFPLVTHHGTEAAKRSGRLYLGILMGTSIAFLLLAVAWTQHLAGTTDFRVGGILDGHISVKVLPWLLALYALGTAKAALMPFHRWLPAAMVAPTPVSALLHAVAVVKAGVFTITKVVIYIFGLDLLSDTGASTLVAGFGCVYADLSSDHCIDPEQPETTFGLFYDQPAGLYRLGGVVGDPGGFDRRRAAHRDPCHGQDHTVLLRGCDLCRCSQIGHQPNAWSRAENAVDLCGFSGGLFVDHWYSSSRRCLE